MKRVRLNNKSLKSFTLIEMLVVIAVIGILAGLLLPALVAGRRRAIRAAAANDIKNLELALKQYELDFGRYPPDDYTGTIAGLGDGANGPSECLVYFLGNTFTTVRPVPAGEVGSNITAGPYIEFKEKQLRDVDGDGFMEYIDPFGYDRGYIYDLNRPETGTFNPGNHNRASFDIYSFGPDGKDDGGNGDGKKTADGTTNDDLNNW